jgi:tRNA pseudouridine32 synthase/23S rRNA pseudouridine746 synthase
VARKLTTSGRDRGRPLVDYLAERLGLAPAAAAALVRAGSVYVGRARIEEPERALDAGERIIVYESETAAVGEPADSGTPPRDAAGRESSAPADSGTPPRDAAGRESAARESAASVPVVHRDGEVLVVDKPAGVPSQATRERSSGALDRLVARDEPEARLFHRLDRDASGLVLFTLGPAAQRRFAALVRDGRLERRYIAVVWGHVELDAGRLDRPIGPDPRDHRRMSTGGHGRPALTHYRALRRGLGPGGAPTTLLEIDLSTGRTHQIRVHLADAGHPLLGDRLYGRDDGVARLCLHAARLAWPGAPPVISPAPALFDALVAG